MKTRHFIFLINLLFIIPCLTMSCSKTVSQIGTINLISERNFNTNGEYHRLASYVGLDKKEIRKKRNETIEEAINNTVKSVPGGEYIMNAKIFMINQKYFAVEGDVWGTKVQEFKGFKVGSKVQWKSNFKTRTGVITHLKDDNKCVVREDSTSDTKVLEYSKLTTIEN